MARNGKIAHLPREIRNELNRRLEEGEAGNVLLQWLNELPEVKSVLQGRFAGLPISKQNLCEWKAGGYQEWLARRQTLAEARELTADAGELREATGGQLTDNLATVLAARYAALLSGWDGEVTEKFRCKLRVLRSLCRDIVELRRSDHSGARVNMERQRLDRETEKTEEEVVEYFKHWVALPEVRDWIRQNWSSPEEPEQPIREFFAQSPGDAGDGQTPVKPESNPVKPKNESGQTEGKGRGSGVEGEKVQESDE
jgi:hypothetical protein